MRFDSISQGFARLVSICGIFDLSIRSGDLACFSETIETMSDLEVLSFCQNACTFLSEKYFYESGLLFQAPPSHNAVRALIDRCLKGKSFHYIYTIECQYIDHILSSLITLEHTTKLLATRAASVLLIASMLSSTIT